MNPQSALSAVRENLNEAVSAFWSDTEIYGNLSQAETILASKTGGIEAITSRTSVTGTSFYTSPDNLLRINRLTYDGKKLKRVNGVDVDYLDGSTYGKTVSTGNPEVYKAWAGGVTLYPTPDAAKTIIFDIIKSPTLINTASTQFSIINAAIHQHVIPYATYKAYLKAGEVNLADRWERDWKTGLDMAVSTKLDEDGWDKTPYVLDEDLYAGGQLGMD